VPRGRSTLFSLVGSLAFILGLNGCGNNSAPTYEYDTRLDPGLKREIQALGHHNWIVIADESFPLHTRRGVRTLLVDKEIPAVLGGVIDVIDTQQHVRPIFYRSRELAFVKNDDAPGVDTFRMALEDALRGYQPRELQYRSLAVLLEDESKTFAVLVIKTKTALPYSSIFIELDSAYWDSRQESKLRSAMETPRS
jgi:L-fucose mutarotase/ribose pyranase (RbsD/FucU family)